MEMQDPHGGFCLAALLGTGPGNAHDAGDHGWPLAGKTVGHEPPVGKPNDVHAAWVYGRGCLRLGNKIAQVGNIVHALAIEIAAGLGGMKEAGTAVVFCSVGHEECHATGDRKFRKAHGSREAHAAVAIAVEREDQGNANPRWDA